MIGWDMLYNDDNELRGIDWFSVQRMHGLGHLQAGLLTLCSTCCYTPVKMQETRKHSLILVFPSTCIPMILRMHSLRAWCRMRFCLPHIIDKVAFQLYLCFQQAMQPRSCWSRNFLIATDQDSFDIQIDLPSINSQRLKDDW
jgi:hypothetical protein